MSAGPWRQWSGDRNARDERPLRIAATHPHVFGATDAATPSDIHNLKQLTSNSTTY